MDKEKVYIGADMLDAPHKMSGKMVYYRMDDVMHGLLCDILKTHGEVQGIVLDKDGKKYGWNIGFMIPEKKPTVLGVKI
jgi:hypothetical protein